MNPTLALPHFLFINGPPGSGKSTLADLICASNPSALRESFAEPIRSMIYSVFFPSDGPIDYQVDLHDSATKSANLLALCRLNHDETSLFGPTVREAMIEWSESYMKRLFGPDIFGRLLFSRCVEQTMFYAHFIIDDSGFVPEASHVISRVGADNCHLVRLHRAGCDFRSDSRGYITLPGVQTLDLNNSGHPDQMIELLAAEFNGSVLPGPTLGAL